MTMRRSSFLQKIREEFEEEISQGELTQTHYYRDGAMGSKIETPMFRLTISQSKQVLLAESKIVRKAVIKRLEELEKTYMPQNLPEALRAYAAELEEKERIKLIAEEKQKTINMLVHENKLYNCTEIAKELGLKSAKALNKLLEEKRIQYKSNGTWVLYAKYSNLGYVSIKQNVLDSGRIVYDRKWTGEGREFLLRRMK